MLSAEKLQYCIKILYTEIRFVKFGRSTVVDLIGTHVVAMYTKMMLMPSLALIERRNGLQCHGLIRKNSFTF
jgi:hypothetical protein